MKKILPIAFPSAPKRNFLKRLAVDYLGTNGASKIVKFAKGKVSFNNLSKSTSSYMTLNSTK